MGSISRSTALSRMSSLSPQVLIHKFTWRAALLLPWIETNL